MNECQTYFLQLSVAVLLPLGLGFANMVMVELGFRVRFRIVGSFG